MPEIGLFHFFPTFTAHDNLPSFHHDEIAHRSSCEPVLDPQTMVDVISKPSGNSDVFQYTAPRLLSRNFDGIRMDITYEDLELETQVAKSLQVPMFMANVAQQVYQMGRAAGFGSEDTSAIVKVYEQLTGASLARK
jgi:hypothetical protein